MIEVGKANKGNQMFIITIRTNEQIEKTFLVSRFDLIKMKRTWDFFGHTMITMNVYK